MPDFGLYVHVPFCRAKCGYCDFVSYLLGGERDVDVFVRALAREAAAAAGSLGDFRLRTVYLGGGTPTAVGSRVLSGLIGSLGAVFDLRSAREFTCEANPESATPAVLDVLAHAGVRRLSLGAQSFRDKALRRLGRVHSGADVRAAFACARAAGFGNISLDLMYGLPGESPDDWSEDLREALALGPEHISVYCLELAEEAALYRSLGPLDLPDGDLAADMYYLAKELLETAGYVHYEISNYARPGYECWHNVNYWRDGTYVGLGPSAASHFGGARFKNPRGLDEYARAASAGRWPLSAAERSDPGREARTAFVLGLRLLSGVDLDVFAARRSFDARSVFKADIKRLTDDGLLAYDGALVRLSKKGLFLSDEVFSRLI